MSVVDTLYWTETVTMSRVDVDGEPGDVCVLMWLVVYSRAVVYATELESALENGNEREKRQLQVAAITRIRLAPTWDGVVTCYRQYLRVRRPAIFTRAWPAATLRATTEGLVFRGIQGQPFDHLHAY